MQYRQAQRIIDLEAIQVNIETIKRQLPAGVKVFAVVKADGYGHGAVEVARKALASGAEKLCVAILEEAVTLRQAGIKAPILVMGYTDPQYARVAAELGVELTVWQSDWLASVKTQTLPAPVGIHIKLDTGMGRVGLKTTQAVELFLANLSQQVEVKGCFTHFAQADASDDSYFRYQNDGYRTLIEPVKARFNDTITYHTGNSAAAMQYPDAMYDAVRFGIGMYGLYPSHYLAESKPVTLKPALTVEATLIHVKQLAKGEKISYGLTYETSGEEWIGTIPVGYADGIQRAWQDFEVLIDGKRMPLVGRVCMDQCMVRLDKQYPVGETVTFVGKNGEQSISLEAVAEHLKTINYEVSCLFTERLPRHYRNR